MTRKQRFSLMLHKCHGITTISPQDTVFSSQILVGWNFKPPGSTACRRRLQTPVDAAESSRHAQRFARFRPQLIVVGGEQPCRRCLCGISSRVAASRDRDKILGSLFEVGFGNEILWIERLKKYSASHRYILYFLGHTARLTGD